MDDGYGTRGGQTIGATPRPAEPRRQGASANLGDSPSRGGHEPGSLPNRGDSPSRGAQEAGSLPQLGRLPVPRGPRGREPPLMGATPRPAGPTRQGASPNWGDSPSRGGHEAGSLP